MNTALRALRTLLVAAPIALFAACGATKPAACPNPPNGEHCKGGEGCEHCKDGSPCEHCKHHAEGHGEHHGEHHEQGEHAALPPELHALHEVLAPVWHTTPGPTRVAKACDGAKALSEKAKAVNDAELTKDFAAVEAACAKDGRAEVEPTLTVAHERFHALVKPAKKD
jgi:hypothetical protein